MPIDLDKLHRPVGRHVQPPISTQQRSWSGQMLVSSTSVAASSHVRVLAWQGAARSSLLDCRVTINVSVCGEKGRGGWCLSSFCSYLTRAPVRIPFDSLCLKRLTRSQRQQRRSRLTTDAPPQTRTSIAGDGAHGAPAQPSFPTLDQRDISNTIGFGVPIVISCGERRVEIICHMSKRTCIENATNTIETHQPW
jgi:hypothetical protein